MTNETIATTALAEVRKSIKARRVVSSNKWLPGEKAEDAQARRVKYTHDARVQAATSQTPLQAAQNLFNLGVANCTDLCWIAREHTPSDEAARVAIVRAGIQHVFLAIGADFNGQTVPRNLSQWKPAPSTSGEIWICDPWADLAASQFNYAVEWEYRMEEWADGDIQLAAMNPATPWESPERWKELIAASPKAELDQPAPAAPGPPSRSNYGDYKKWARRWARSHS